MCGLTAYLGTDERVKEKLQKNFEFIKYRGPDSTNTVKDKNVFLGFHRLAIMGLTPEGNQPFAGPDFFVMCNGEIYNYKDLKDKNKYSYKSHSDCEVLVPLFINKGISLVHDLDAEYALIIYDKKNNKLMAARDPIGIRPLFYGYTKDNDIMFSSEVKVINDICTEVFAFPPGHYYDGDNFVPYIQVERTYKVVKGSVDVVCDGIKEKLISAVVKRLDSDAKLGALLSGGLDSSLVCAIATRNMKNKLTTFAIGIKDDPIDTKYARKVADFLKTDHHEVLFSEEDIYANLNELIYKLETWDITTIRASIGMYLLCKYIREKTDVRCVLTGELSDELFGYKYTDFAPNAKEFQKEAEKRIREIYMYDVLRADRCIAGASLEARVPFSDTEFVKYVMSIDPEMKMNKYNMGKYLLRKSFEKGDWLPNEILYRDKAAFSDAVGHSMVDYLKAFAEKKYTDKEFKNLSKKYTHGTPNTKEALLYREVFESFYAGRSHLISDLWLPNKDWKNCNVSDPSARVLPNYGKSGE